MFGTWSGLNMLRPPFTLWDLQVCQRNPRQKLELQLTFDSVSHPGRQLTQDRNSSLSLPVQTSVTAAALQLRMTSLQLVGNNCHQETATTPLNSTRLVPAGETWGQLLILSSLRVALLLATSTLRDGSSTGVSSIFNEDRDLELTNTTVRAEVKWDCGRWRQFSHDHFQKSNQSN